MKTLTAYKTLDGKYFESKEEALAYENRGMLSAQIEAFLQGRPVTSTADLIVAWESFRSQLFCNESIELLSMTCRTENCLKSAQIRTISDLVANTANDLMKIPNLGRKSLKEIIEELAQRGLKLGGAV